MPRKKTAKTEPVQAGFDPYADIGGAKEPTKEPTGGENDIDKRLASLGTAVASLTKGLETLQSTQLALMSAPAPQAPAPTLVKPAEATEMDLSGLPDPVTDPEGYSKGLNSRLQKAITDGVATISQSQMAAQEETRRRGERTDGLWEGFTEAYPDLAEDEQRVAIAAEQAARKAARKGVDLDRYMFTTTPQFYADVAKEMGTLWPAGEEKAGEGEGESKPAAKHPTEAEAAEAASRTGGIMGGIGAGSKPPTADEAEAEKKDTGLIGEVEDYQRKTGFYA